MPTNKQVGWLKLIEEGEVKKYENPRKYSAYMRRIQRQIEERLKNMLWVAEHFPDIFKDEEREYTDESLDRHRRLKTLLKICLFINPLSEDPVLIKMMGKLVPQFDIELIKKSPTPPKPLEISKCGGCGRLYEDKDIVDGCPNCGNRTFQPIK